MRGEDDGGGGGGDDDKGKEGGQTTKIRGGKMTETHEDKEK